MKFTRNGTVVGTVYSTSCRNNSTADASFLQASSGITPTNVLSTGATIIAANKTYEYPVNTTVYMYGVKSGLKSGKITSTNVSTDNGTYKLTNITKASYSSQDGDSGAPIMSYDGNYGGQTRYVLIGIHSALSEATSASYYSKYTRIAAELGVTAITS